MPRENPLILDKIAIFSKENPLHIASIGAHVDFVKEILRLKPAFAREINQEGFSAVHLAAACSRVEIVREIRREREDYSSSLGIYQRKGRGNKCNAFQLP